MQEYTTPTTWDDQTVGGIAETLWRRERSKPDQGALAYRDGDSFREVTLSEIKDRVESLAKGLIWAGVRRGDRVCLFSPTRIEYTYVDLAIWAIGGVGVTIYETSSAEQVEWIVKDSGAKVIFISGGERREVFKERAGKLGTCGMVFDFDDLMTLERLGEEITDEELERRRRSVVADDLATLVYTSGTTGNPKGVELTHRNLAWTLGNAVGEMSEIFNEEGSTLMFLPLAHIFARMIQVAAIQTGAVINYSTGLPNLVEELEMTRPTFIFAAPRVFEKLYNRARHRAHEDGKGRIFELAADTAIRYSVAKDAGDLAIKDRLLHALFEPLVYKKLRAVLGGRAKYAISGSAPLGERLGHFYRGIGLEVLEGYGLTETSAGGSANRVDAVKIGTVGRPTPGSTVRIADDGEILIKGGHVMRGYFNKPEATREVIDDEGWFHTGDIGKLDGDGFLRITGRKKEILVTAGGKNVVPAPLEHQVSSHRLVGGCVLVGDNRPFISALIALDPDEWQTWAETRGLEGPIGDHTDHPELREEIGKTVDQANQGVSRAESIRAFRILPEDFSIEGGELTTSLKVRRKAVEDKYADVITDIYREVSTSAI